MWYGITRCVLYEILRFSGEIAIPRPKNSSISLNSTSGIEHDAVADDVHHAGPEDADRQQVRRVFLAADADGVPGVGAAAVADDDVGVLGEEIDDLALALVAPLEADDNGISLQERGHNRRLSVMRGCEFKRCIRTVKGDGGGVKQSRSWRVAVVSLPAS